MQTAHLYAPLRRELIALIQTLGRDEWATPTVCGDWTVGDVVGHLLGVELSNVGRRRDGWSTGPAPGEDLASWLAAFNEEWVRAARRLSPEIAARLLDVAGAWFEEWVASVDLDATGDAVSWAGPERAPVWLDVAREYTERWTHQAQIREALGRPLLDEARYLGPVIATFAHALPHALRAIDAPAGTVATLRVTGPAGGVWHVHRLSSHWALRPTPRPRHGDAGWGVLVSFLYLRGRWCLPPPGRSRT